MKSMFGRRCAAAALVACDRGGAQAKETVVWWDFLGGGDGVRMKKLIEDFNTEHNDTIEIQATTLDMGHAVLRQGPDLRRGRRRAGRDDLSRLAHPAWRSSQNVLAEITADDMKAMGLSEASFAKATWEAVHVDGKQYAVPFDTASDRPLLQQGQARRRRAHRRRRPAEGPQRRRQLHRRAEEAEGRRHQVRHVATLTADGDFAFRTFYSLLCQQDGVDRRRRRLAARRQPAQADQGGAGRSPTG